MDGGISMTTFIDITVVKMKLLGGYGSKPSR